MEHTICVTWQMQKSEIENFRPIPGLKTFFIKNLISNTEMILILF
jgi:hypothetical protein